MKSTLMNLPLMECVGHFADNCVWERLNVMVILVCVKAHILCMLLILSKL
jgi:hypothetical protein